MTKLASLKSHLASLRRQRQLVRWGTGWSALATAVLWALAGIFLIDWLFQHSMDLVQRVILDCLAFACLVWAFRKFTRPWLGVKEDELEMALFVERQHNIDSDLVAAIQFEQPEAARWGSTQLETAVIDRVATLGRGLNVFHGLNREQFMRRSATCGITALVLVGLALAFPQYSRVFFQRLLLGSQHYPTRTQIAGVVVNDRLVLSAEQGTSVPARLNAPEGRSLEFLVKCAGEIPEQGTAQLVSGTTGQRRDLELHPLSLAERKAILQAAQTELSSLDGTAKLQPGDPSVTPVLAKLTLDAPDVAATLKAASEVNTEVLAQLKNGLAERLEAWPEGAEEHAVFTANLPRLADPLRYKLYLGDAWTDTSRIGLVPLPLVQTRFEVKPPEYASSVKMAAPQQGDRHLSVLEGSQVEVAIESANKPLSSAWLVLRSEKDKAAPAQRFALSAADTARRRWRLEQKDTAFASVRQSLAYEIQVIDDDGLSLPEPLAGRVVLKEDRPPAVNLAVQDRIWLPTATPKLRYTVRDDYGIGRMVFNVKVEHQDGRTSTATRELWPFREKPVLAGELPASGLATLDLAGLKLAWKGEKPAATAEKPQLAKGDRVEITLEVFDFRGQIEGKSSVSETVVLPIGHQSDILTFVDRSLGSAEEKATITIDTQTGIGDSP